MMRQHGVRRRSGFSLVELLTVIFIIALLIGILIPSLNAARNAAKKSSSKTMLNSLNVGLEMFKQDNGSDYPQSHGYPPSFSHPPLTNFGATFNPSLGENPFILNKPVMYGAQWLPMMLMGADTRGYIKRGEAPRTDPPEEWYVNPDDDGAEIDKKSKTARAALYVSADNAPALKLKQVPGRAHADFANFDQVSERPVFVDAWEQPILYYVASTAGKATNMVSKVHNPDNNYVGGDQEKGPPYYFHIDNVGFTGNTVDETTKETNGWNFGTGAKHAIAKPGDELTADQLIEEANKETFARYIVDRKIYSTLKSGVAANTPLRPVNAESFLLISPGVDGRYGTNDDVSNIPSFLNEG